MRLTNIPKLVLLMGVLQTSPLWAEDKVLDLETMVQYGEHVVDQITDPKATAAQGMFRFDPSLLRLEPGEKLVVLNSTGEHTVHTIPEIWVEGVEPVAISNSPRTDVQFDTPGVYALQCRRHGLYGMVMLIVVGDGDGGGVTDLEPVIADMRARDLEKNALREIWSQYQAESN